MIHVNATTAEEIAVLLRGGGECGERYKAEEVACRLLGKPRPGPGMIVTAPRQSGKTIELLKFAEERYPNGLFAVLCLNESVQQSILYQYRWLIKNINVTPPLMLTPSSISGVVVGLRRPIFVDEWSLIPEDTRSLILAMREAFQAAVTS